MVPLGRLKEKLAEGGLKHLASAVGQLDPRRLELASFLQRRQAPCLFQLHLPRLALCLLPTCVGKPRTRLGEHLFFILVHVDRIGPRRFTLRVRVDFTWSKAPRVVAGGVLGLALSATGRLIKQSFVVFQALRGGAPNDGCYRAPLRWHELCEVKQLLLLLWAPLGLLDRGVQPLQPACLRARTGGPGRRAEQSSDADARQGEGRMGGNRGAESGHPPPPPTTAYCGYGYQHPWRCGPCTVSLTSSRAARRCETIGSSRTSSPLP